MAIEIGFDDWLRLGVEAGWVSPPYCETHDGSPLTESEEENADFFDDDYCIHALRLIPYQESLTGFFSRWGKDIYSTTVPLRDEVRDAIKTI